MILKLGVIMILGFLKHVKNGRADIDNTKF